MELDIRRRKRFSDLFEANTVHGGLIWIVIILMLFFGILCFLLNLEIDKSVYDGKSKLNTYQIILEKNNGIIDTLLMKSSGEMFIDNGPNYKVFIKEKGENFIGASINNFYSFENIKKYSIKKIK